jgi:hypothetical protein
MPSVDVPRRATLRSASHHDLVMQSSIIDVNSAIVHFLLQVLVRGTHSADRTQNCRAIGLSHTLSFKRKLKSFLGCTTL